MAVSQQKLLIIAASLAAARFILFPLLDWQAEQREQLIVTSQQLERSLRLQSSAPEQQQRLTQLAELKNNIVTLYPNATQTTQFRLSIQRQLEQQFTAAGLEVTLFDWLSNQAEQNDLAERHQVRIVVQGQSQNLMQVFIDKLLAEPWLNIRDIHIQQRSMGRRAGTGTTATLSLEVIALHSGLEHQND